MEEAHKEILMTSVICDTIDDVQNIFSQCELTQDDSFFDYELLKAALERKHQAIITFLLDIGCRVKKPSEINSEETPLHLAIKLGNINIIRKILNKNNGASIYDKNTKGDTPLQVAFKEKRYEIVDEILNHFYGSNSSPQLKGSLKNLNPMDKDDVQHFHIACIRNNIYVVKLYVTCGFDVNSLFDLDVAELSKLNPLHYAVIKGYSELFDCLLPVADLSIKYNSKGQTLLHIIYYSDVSRTRSISRFFDYGNDTVFVNSIDDNNVSHFHLSCMINNPYNIQVFIDKGVDVNSSVSLNCSVNPGFTPLHFAVKYDCENVVQLLLENGANCNQVDKEGNTPLHLACMKEGYINRQLIQILLDYKACPTAVNKKQLTPLHQAFYNIYVDNNILDMIISKIPREVNLTDAEGLSFFHIVCTRNDIIRVHDFLESGVDIESRVDSGKYRDYTALYFAVLYNQKDVVEILLNRNAQVNFKIYGGKFTSLHLACSFNMKFREINIKDDNNDNPANFDWSSSRKNHFDIIKLLLLHGADVNAQDSSGKTPLLSMCSIDRNYHKEDWVSYSKINFNREISARLKEIIEILLLNDANVNARSNNRDSVLHIICKNYFLKNSEELIEYLISKGADINATDGDGLTPLHVAVETKKVKLIQIFLKHKADVNAKSKEGKIPLQLLIKQFTSAEDKIILSLLLENGSDVNMKSKNESVLWLDVLEEHKIFVLEKLLNYGADINIEDSFGHPLIIRVLTKWQFQINNSGCYTTNAKAFYFIFIHVQRLLAANFYVNDKVEQICFKLHKILKFVFNLKIYNSAYLDNIYGICLEELNRLQLIKVDNYTSLFDILQKDAHALSKHVKNTNLLKILEDQNTYNTFPLYSYLLKIKFNKGLERRNAVEFAKASLTFIIRLSLPDLCCDFIFKYLTNEDVVNLNAAAKRSYKRKLISSGKLSDSEPSVKLEKIH